MARNSLNEFSETASENTDIGGVAMTGSAPASNIDDGQRAAAAIWAKAVNGTTPINDTWAWRNSVDATKKFRPDGDNIPTGTTRVIDVEHLYQINTLGARPIAQTYYMSAASAQTHTFDTNAKYYRVFLMGAGGDGGNVDGQGSGTGASASGGNSGNWGWSDYIERPSALLTATYTVGAAGTAETTAGADGCNGNNTTWNDGTISYTCRGGKGGTGRTAGVQYGVSAPTANNSNTGTLYGTYEPGDVGQGSASFNVSVRGGVTPYGTCVPVGMVIGTGSDGAAASGNGAGGGGAAVASVSTNYRGGRGAPGMIIVEEY